MHVIGTAGHVDHGKSTLVQALTGIHPDRLKEEREREMTIDLGFAWLTLPNGEEIGIIDVPGHRDFIENMLAGVGGIDAALFIIAADEGVMPQTREHLAILDLLQIQGGVVVITKIDLIDDPDWLDLIDEDVRKTMEGTILEEAEIVRVSARSRQGIPELLNALSACLAERPPRADLGRPRLPVDRVFTIAGFGTVVTGTLTDGQFHSADEVQILPHDLRGRIRGLQTHKQKEEVAVPGSRTAVNISGVDVDQIRRGDVLAHPGDYAPTRLVDVRLRLLSDASQALEHNTQVKVYICAAEVPARLRLLGVDELLPAESGWAQLELNLPVVAVRNDRFILRRPSPGETLGGGVVVDPSPKGRHKRFSTEVLNRLEALNRGTPAEILLQALLALGAATAEEVVNHSTLEASLANQACHELFLNGQLVLLEGRSPTQLESPEMSMRKFDAGSIVASKSYWEMLSGRAANEVNLYHKTYPLKNGIPREELKSRLKLSSKLFNAALGKWVSEGTFEENGLWVQRSGFVIHFSPDQQHQVDALLGRFAASPYSPPTLKECQTAVGADVYNALVDMGLLIFVPPDVVFRTQDYEYMVAEVRRLLVEGGTLSAAQLRDHFNTSRRYTLALLEYLDGQGITIRDGDVRRLKQIK